MNVFSYMDNIRIIHMDGNKGIAAAQNAGAKFAFGQGQAILFLDQDSNPNETFISDLLDARAEARRCGLKLLLQGLSNMMLGMVFYLILLK